MTSIVRRADPGRIGFDLTERVTAARAAADAAKGYSFYVRYVSRSDDSRASNAARGAPDLSPEETADILSAGLAVMAVQHVPPGVWRPSGQLGQAYGHYAAASAAGAGLSKGVTLWLDLECVDPATAAADVIDYCNSWFGKVSQAGFTPGIYVGADCGLDGEQLFLDLKFKTYWKSGSKVPDIPQRGYQMVQYIRKLPPDGREVDQNVTQNDRLGDAVLWLAPN